MALGRQGASQHAPARARRIARGRRLGALAAAAWLATARAGAQDVDSAGERSTTSAGAEGTTITVEAPEGCASAASLEAEVRRLVGSAGELVVPGVGAITITLASVEGEGFRVALASEAEDGTPGGTRTLSDPSCTALADAAALIVAMMIDPDAALLAAAAPPPPPPPPSPPTPAPRPRERARDLASPRGARAARPLPPLGVGIGGVLDVGLLPGPSGGPSADVVVRIGAFDLRAGVTYLAPTSARPAPGTGADVSAVLGSVGGCVRPLAPSDPWLAICAGVHAGALLAQPVGVPVPAAGTPAGALVQAAAGLALPWVPADELDIEIAAEITFALLRPRFEILPADVGSPTLVHEVPLAPGFRARLRVHFDLRP